MALQVLRRLAHQPDRRPEWRDLPGVLDGAGGAEVKPTYQSDCGRVTLYLADCLDVLPTLGKVDAVITDPPYGCDKAEWDSAFPTAWYAPTRDIADAVYTITGSVGLKDSMTLCGAAVVDVIAARNTNGITRGPIGFSNWLATVCVGKKPPQGPNAFDFAVRGDMPDHPSPKPIQFMERLLRRLFNGGELLCDPFMGSGTTGVAALHHGCNFIGIEIEPKYYEIAKRRILAELAQKKLFDTPATSE